jgi:hypothetical protein
MEHWVLHFVVGALTLFRQENVDRELGEASAQKNLVPPREASLAPMRRAPTCDAPRPPVAAHTQARHPTDAPSG